MFYLEIHYYIFLPRQLSRKNKGQRPRSPPVWETLYLKSVIFFFFFQSLKQIKHIFCIHSFTAFWIFLLLLLFGLSIYWQIIFRIIDPKENIFLNHCKLMYVLFQTLKCKIFLSMNNIVLARLIYWWSYISYPMISSFRQGTHA